MNFPIIDVYTHPHYGDSVRYENYAALDRLYGRLLMSDRDGECRITAEEGEMAEAALKKARGEE